MGELAELISAVSEYEMKGYGSKSYFYALFDGYDLTAKVKELKQDVADKIGDVAIICQALMHRYGLKPEEVEKRVTEKLAEYDDI